MEKQSNILVIGSINMDLVITVPRFPIEGETLTGKSFFTSPGGKGANQAVAAARLGAKVSMIGCIGDDQFGKQLVQNFRREKVNIGQIKFTPHHPTGTAIITINDHAQNQIIVIPGANSLVTEKNILSVWQALKIKPQAVLLQLEIPLSSVITAAELAKKDNSLVILNPAPAQQLPVKLLKLVDYLIPNEHEARLITGKKSIKEAAVFLHNQGVKNIIITLGDKGAYLFNDKQSVIIPPYNVKAVDPTACGDAFIAAFSVSFLQGKSPIESIEFANAAGALTTTKIGAQPFLPFLLDLEQFLSSASN